MTDFGILLQQAGYSVSEATKHLDYSEGHINRWIRGDESPRDSVTRLLELEIVNPGAILDHRNGRII
jgi:DNA (cytosine-5)-methyltransferase 1